MKQAHAAGFHFFSASPAEKDAPTTSRATGVAVPPTVLRAEVSMAGRLMRSRAKGMPATMPRMIGFFSTFRQAFFTIPPPPPGGMRRPVSSS